MTDNYIIETNSEGEVKITEDVISAISTVAAESVDGVINIQSNLKSSVTSVTEKLGVKNFNKGVKVNIGEKEAVIELLITVLYGRNIVDICKEVQDKVKEAVKNMTDLEVVEVNVHVSGISLPDKEKARA